MEKFEEMTRDTHIFKRRVGEHPTAQASEPFDFSGVMHRNGTVFSAVNGADFSKQADVSCWLSRSLILLFLDLTVDDAGGLLFLYPK